MLARLVTMALALTSVSAGDPRCHEKAADGGNCKGSFQMWTYTEEKGCHSFIYGGCGGNMNRFSTETECEDLCQQGHSLTPLEDDSDECCPVMKIGSLTYNLVGREDKTFALLHGCLTDCIYILDNDNSKMVCFQKGNTLPAVPLDLEATNCKFYSDDKGEKGLATVLGECGIVKGGEVGWLQILNCQDFMEDVFMKCDQPGSSDGLDQAEIYECEVEFLETLEKLGIRHLQDTDIFLQNFSEMDGKGDGNGVITSEEWRQWRRDQKTGRSLTESGESDKSGDYSFVYGGWPTGSSRSPGTTINPETGRRVATGGQGTGWWKTTGASDYAYYSPENLN